MCELPGSMYSGVYFPLQVFDEETRRKSEDIRWLLRRTSQWPPSPYPRAPKRVPPIPASPKDVPDCMCPRLKMCEKTRVMFVCLGNICRSPMAEAVFRQKVAERCLQDHFTIHSAGLGDWHAGSPGDARMLMVLKKYKVEVNHKARQIRPDEFEFYDYIFGMDEDNIKALRKMAPPNTKAKLMLFGCFDPEGETIIEDPYFSREIEAFEKNYEQCVRCSDGFLNSLR